MKRFVLFLLFFGSASQAGLPVCGQQQITQACDSLKENRDIEYVQLDGGRVINPFYIQELKGKVMGFAEFQKSFIETQDANLNYQAAVLSALEGDKFKTTDKFKMAFAGSLSLAVNLVNERAP